VTAEEGDGDEDDAGLSSSSLSSHPSPARPARRPPSHPGVVDSLLRDMVRYISSQVTAAADEQQDAGGSSMMARLAAPVALVPSLLLARALVAPA